MLGSLEDDRVTTLPKLLGRDTGHGRQGFEVGELAVFGAMLNDRLRRALLEMQHLGALVRGGTIDAAPAEFPDEIVEDEVEVLIRSGGPAGHLLIEEFLPLRPIGPSLHDPVG